MSLPFLNIGHMGYINPTLFPKIALSMRYLPKYTHGAVSVNVDKSKIDWYGSLREEHQLNSCFC